MTVALLGPNGVDSVLLANPNNKAKTVDASDLALDSFVKSRIGSAGGLNFRNKIVDGLFDYWDATTQTTSGFLSDIMWHNDHSGTTKTHSKQTLTAGVDLPAIDYPNLSFYSRTVVTSVAGVNNYCRKYQCIEDVRTLAGKSAVLSFYAKAAAAGTIGINLEQDFGTGGSPSAAVASISPQLVNLTTSWVRYSVPVVIPSISGKVLGTNADHRLIVAFWFDAGATVATPYGISAVGQKSGTYDITGVQLEEGTLASEFEYLHPTISQQLVERHRVQVVLVGGYNPGSTGYTSRDCYLATPMRSSPAVTFGLSYSAGVWTSQNTININDSAATSTSATANADDRHITVFRAQPSNDGECIRCTVVLDARL